MIWHGLRRSAPAAHALGTGSVECADEVWAARDRPGPVPEGWVGLRVASDGACLGWAQATQTLPAPPRKAPSGTVWWVRAGARSFEFAPWPAQAPEAGLLATVELDCNGAAGMTLLASALSNWQEDVTGPRLAAQWREWPLIKALPPCVQPAGLDACARALEQRVWVVWQLRVLGLKRVDLSLPPEPVASVATPRAGCATGPGSEVVAGAAGPSSAELSGRCPTQTVQVQPPGPSLRQLQQQDRQAWALVARELPRLEVGLQRCWASGGWSAEPALAQRQRALTQRLGLMAGKLGALPLLNVPKEGSALSLEARHRLVWAHSADVLNALAGAQFALAALPQGKVPPDEQRLQALEQAVLALDVRVHERLHPWWE